MHSPAGVQVPVLPSNSQAFGSVMIQQFVEETAARLIVPHDRTDTLSLLGIALHASSEMQVPSMPLASQVAGVSGSGGGTQHYFESVPKCRKYRDRDRRTYDITIAITDISNE